MKVLVTVCLPLLQDIYRVSIKSFPDYKHLLQENYVEYKHIFFDVLTSKVSVIWVPSTEKMTSERKEFLANHSTVTESSMVL